MQNPRLTRQAKPLPVPLGQTLARRVQQLREFRNLTVKDLAKASQFTVERIEDIEAGLETWLSVTDRQKLAKGLAVEPILLKEVEYRTQAQLSSTDPFFSESIRAGLTDSILRGAFDLECPKCGSTLKCSVQEGVDLEGKPTYFACAYCLKCPYILR